VDPFPFQLSFLQITFHFQQIREPFPKPNHLDSLQIIPLDLLHIKICKGSRRMICRKYYAVLLPGTNSNNDLQTIKIYFFFSSTSVFDMQLKLITLFFIDLVHLYSLCNILLLSTILFKPLQSSPEYLT
jgi:hypothetical protein